MSHMILKRTLEESRPLILLILEHAARGTEEGLSPPLPVPPPEEEPPQS
jgi:hypothetical protein